MHVLLMRKNQPGHSLVRIVFSIGEGSDETAQNAQSRLAFSDPIHDVWQ